MESPSVSTSDPPIMGGSVVASQTNKDKDSLTKISNHNHDNNHHHPETSNMVNAMQRFFGTKTLRASSRTNKKAGKLRFHYARNTSSNNKASSLAPPLADTDRVVSCSPSSLFWSENSASEEDATTTMTTAADNDEDDDEDCIPFATFSTTPSSTAYHPSSQVHESLLPNSVLLLQSTVATKARMTTETTTQPKFTTTSLQWHSTMKKPTTKKMPLVTPEFTARSSRSFSITSHTTSTPTEQDWASFPYAAESMSSTADHRSTSLGVAASPMWSDRNDSSSFPSSLSRQPPTWNAKNLLPTPQPPQNGIRQRRRSSLDHSIGTNTTAIGDKVWQRRRGSLNHSTSSSAGSVTISISSATTATAIGDGTQADKVWQRRRGSLNHSISTTTGGVTTATTATTIGEKQERIEPSIPMLSTAAIKSSNQVENREDGEEETTNEPGIPEVRTDSPRITIGGNSAGGIALITEIANNIKKAKETQNQAQDSPVADQKIETTFSSHSGGNAVSPQLFPTAASAPVSPQETKHSWNHAHSSAAVSSSVDRKPQRKEDDVGALHCSNHCLSVAIVNDSTFAGLLGNSISYTQVPVTKREENSLEKVATTTTRTLQTTPDQKIPLFQTVPNIKNGSSVEKSLQIKPCGRNQSPSMEEEEAEKQERIGSIRQDSITNHEQSVTTTQSCLSRHLLSSLSSVSLRPPPMTTPLGGNNHKSRFVPETTRTLGLDGPSPQENEQHYHFPNEPTQRCHGDTASLLKVKLPNVETKENKEEKSVENSRALTQTPTRDRTIPTLLTITNVQEEMPPVRSQHETPAPATDDAHLAVSRSDRAPNQENMGWSDQFAREDGEGRLGIEKMVWSNKHVLFPKSSVNQAGADEGINVNQSSETTGDTTQNSTTSEPSRMTTTESQGIRSRSSSSDKDWPAFAATFSPHSSSNSNSSSCLTEEVVSRWTKAPNFSVHEFTTPPEQEMKDQPTVTTMTREMILVAFKDMDDKFPLVPRLIGVEGHCDNHVDPSTFVGPLASVISLSPSVITPSLFVCPHSSNEHDINPNESLRAVHCETSDQLEDDDSSGQNPSETTFETKVDGVQQQPVAPRVIKSYSQRVLGSFEQAMWFAEPKDTPDHGIIVAKIGGTESFETMTDPQNDPDPIIESNQRVHSLVRSPCSFFDERIVPKQPTKTNQDGPFDFWVKERAETIDNDVFAGDRLATVTPSLENWLMKSRPKGDASDSCPTLHTEEFDDFCNSSNDLIRQRTAPAAEVSVVEESPSQMLDESTSQKSESIFDVCFEDMHVIQSSRHTPYVDDNAVSPEGQGPIHFLEFSANKNGENEKRIEDNWKSTSVGMLESITPLPEDEPLTTRRSTLFPTCQSSNPGTPIQVTQNIGSDVGPGIIPAAALKETKIQTTPSPIQMPMGETIRSSQCSQTRLTAMQTFRRDDATSVLEKSHLNENSTEIHEMADTGNLHQGEPTLNFDPVPSAWKRHFAVAHKTTALVSDLFGSQTKNKKRSESSAESNDSSAHKVLREIRNVNARHGIFQKSMRRASLSSVSSSSRMTSTKSLVLLKSSKLGVNRRGSLPESFVMEWPNLVSQSATPTAPYQTSETCVRTVSDCFELVENAFGDGSMCTKTFGTEPDTECVRFVSDCSEVVENAMEDDSIYSKTFGRESDTDWA